MGDVEKLMAWLKLHGNSAPWEEVQQQFSKVFPRDGTEQGGLSAVMISTRNSLPLIGKTAGK